MTGRGLAVAGVVVALLAGGTVARGQPPSCEDERRALMIWIEQLHASRDRHEGETSRLVAGLLKRIDALQAELAATKKEAAPSKAP